MSLYFVAVEPPERLSEQVRLIARDFADRFASSKAYRSFPHITLIPPFQFDEQNESEVVGRFMKFQVQVRSFNLRLHQFNFFLNRHHPVIFIEPEDNDDLVQLYKEVNAAMSTFNYAENFNPHLTVAYRDLSPENFEKAWEEYRDKAIAESFIVNRVSLYRHFAGRWNEIAHRELPT